MYCEALKLQASEPFWSLTSDTLFPRYNLGDPIEESFSLQNFQFSSTIISCNFLEIHRSSSYTEASAPDVHLHLLSPSLSNPNIWISLQCCKTKIAHTLSHMLPIICNSRFSSIEGSFNYGHPSLIFEWEFWTTGYIMFLGSWSLEICWFDVSSAEV